MKLIANKFYVVLFFCVAILALQSCSSGWENIKEGTFNGEKYMIQEKEYRGFSTNRLEYRVKLGKRSALPMDASHTDWQPVYSEEIFGKDPFSYIPELKTNYKNSLRDGMQTTSFGYSMLYISPKKNSEKEFEDYKKFFQSEWPKIDNEYSNKPYSRFPKIMGVVYGEQQNYNKIFKGEFNGEKRMLIVENDGRIRQIIGNSRDGVETFSNISQMVQMPGKRIYLSKPISNSHFTLEKLKTFKDKNGKNPTDYFNIVEKK